MREISALSNFSISWGHIKQTSRDRINIKMSSYQYRKSHCGDKTILRPSYLHNGISYTDKMISLYWISAQVSMTCYARPACMPDNHILVQYNKCYVADMPVLHAAIQLWYACCSVIYTYAIITRYHITALHTQHGGFAIFRFSMQLFIKFFFIF